MVNAYPANMSPNTQGLPLPALDQSTYDPNSASGESPSVSSGYTQPAPNTPSANQIAQAVGKQIQSDKDAQTSPYGMSPSTTGSIAGKAFNTIINPSGSNTFGSQISAIDNFGSNYLGLGSSSSGSTFSGLGTGNFVNAAGDSVAAGTPGATAIGANADIAQSFSDATAMQGATNSALGLNPGAASGFTTTSLSSILGSAGIGALGGGLLAKLTGGNELGGSIGGALGAAGGAALMGTQLGAAIGTLIPIPGLGTIAGTLVGGAIGGMFGNKTPATKAAESGFTVGPQGSIQDQVIKSKNSGTYGGYPSQLDSTLSQVFSGASQQLGINFKNVNVHAGYNSLYGGPGGGFIDINGQRSSFDPNDIQQKNAAIQSALNQAASASGYTNTDALNKYYSSITAPTQGQSFGAPAAPIIGGNTNNSSFASFMASQGKK